MTRASSRPAPTGLLCLFLAALAAPPLTAQSFLGDIPLAGLGNGAPAQPFGITAEPVSNRLFVGIAGSFAASNDVVAIVDPVTDTVVGSIQVGLFPEDVAFAYDALGQPRYGAVTDSSSGSVTIWDAATDTVVATVALPDPLGFGTCYPFGITASEDQSRFYVSTQDGSGDVHAVDLAALAWDPAASFRLAPYTGGRLRHANQMVFLPAARMDAFFTGSQGRIAGWSTGILPFYWDRLLADGSGAFLYASGQDVEILADGTLVLSGYNLGGRLYLLDQGGVLERTIRLPGAPTGSFQGTAVSPDGKLLAACDLPGNAVVLVDLVNREELAVIDLSSVGQGYSLPNEAVFFQDKLYVTCQGSEAVVVFDNLPVPTPGPGFQGTIAVSNSAPMPGDSFTVTVTGPGKLALAASFDDLPATVLGVDLLLGTNPVLKGRGNNVLTRTFTVPNDPALSGTNLFFQGITDATLTRRPTAPRVVVVQ